MCVVDFTGRGPREAELASEPEASVVWFPDLALGLSRIGAEGVPQSQWLCQRLKDVGSACERAETLHQRTSP